MFPADGYIRLSLADFASLSFQHIVSAQDEDLKIELLSRDVPASAAGYTEWASQTEPCISLGWDWYRNSIESRFELADNDVRSNVMLVNSRGQDMGMEATATLISAFLKTLDWYSYLPQPIHVYH